jgi:predicted secreted protein
MALKLAATLGNVAGPVIPNRAFALNQVIETTLDATFMGILIVGVPEDAACGIWRVENGGGATISANALFTNTKDNAATYNVYYEGGYLKVQNKVGAAKTLRISVFGLEAATE